MQKVVSAVGEEVEVSHNLLVLLLSKFQVRLWVAHLQHLEDGVNDDFRQICLRVWEPSQGRGRQEPQWVWLLQSWTTHPLLLNLSPEERGYILHKNVLQRQILEHPTLYLLVTIASLHVDMFLVGGAGKRHQASRQLERGGCQNQQGINKETRFIKTPAKASKYFRLSSVGADGPVPRAFAGITHSGRTPGCQVGKYFRRRCVHLWDLCVCVHLWDLCVCVHVFTCQSCVCVCVHLWDRRDRLRRLRQPIGSSRWHSLAQELDLGDGEVQVTASV